MATAWPSQYRDASCVTEMAGCGQLASFHLSTYWVRVSRAIPRSKDRLGCQGCTANGLA